MTQRIEKMILVNAPSVAVWNALTNHNLATQWMGEPEMEIEIDTDWIIGSPIIVKGFHHVKFENTGTVLNFEPYCFLEYTSLSSLSRLPDQPENYSVIGFQLVPEGNHTRLALTLSNFPTESIFRHLDFYWTTTLSIIKKVAEEHASLISKLTKIK